MSTAIIFDALTHSGKLQEVDVPVKQANTHAELMTDFATNQSTYLATKADLKELDAKIEKLDIKVDTKFEAMQWKLNALFGLISIFIALFGTFITYTHYISQKSAQNSLPPTVKASTFKVG